MIVARLYVVYHNTYQEMASLNKIAQEPQEMAVDVLARIRPMIFNRGSIMPSDIQLTYKILSQPTGTYGDEGYKDGTVELEGIYSVPSGMSTYSISVPHEIQVVNINMADYTATVALYTVVGIKMGAFGSYNSNNADTSLTSVTIPYTVTYLGEDDGSSMDGGSFSRCTSLSSVAFVSTSENPSQLTIIGSNAFYYCTSLASIDIPSTVTTIAPNAFYGCSNLASINFPSESSLTTIGQSAFQNCTALTEVAIPSGVTSLSNSEFYGCSSLKTVWMPGSIQLNGNVFRSCTSLSEIVLEGIPGTTGGVESGTDPFTDDGNDNITLYVETGLAPAYLESAWETDVENETIATLSWNFLAVNFSSVGNDEEGTYYATFYTDAVGEFSSDVTPNIVTEAGESGEITYTEVTGGYIPAGTGLLLTASSYEALNSGDTYYYHPYGVDENSETASVDGNMLYGSTTSEETNVNGVTSGYYFYKLSRNATGDSYSVGFYWDNNDGSAFTCPAYKAYLAVPISSDGDDPAPTHYSFKKDEGDTTGISSIENASEKVVKGIYTIQGVRVSNMNQSGLYIVDGKKVLVK